MSNPLIKQLILYFVLSAAGILFLSAFLCTSASLSAIPVITACLLISVMGISGYLVIRNLRRNVNNINAALRNLKEGKPLRREESAIPHDTDPLLESLYSISDQISHQEEELKNERLMRIRSVIDGQDLERQRLSRELHDGIGQSLIAVKLQLENAGSHEYSRIRASVDVAKDMIDHTIDEVRRVTNALMPAALNEFGLVAALRTRCDEIANSAGLKVVFENSGSVDRLENKSKTYLYRIAQEAISNITKHARATEFRVNISRSEQEVMLIVQDNGKGFIFDPVLFAHRNGLQNIRERVALLNGTFELKSQPEQGTTLKIVIPYKTGDGKNQNHIGG